MQGRNADIDAVVVAAQAMIENVDRIWEMVLDDVAFGYKMLELW